MVRLSATPSRRAASAMVQPCTRSDTSTTTKATSKKMLAFGKPTSSGIDARKMPTAPRSPTQEIKSFSRQSNLKGARHRNTATGRATSISTAATSKAAKMLCGSRCGQASNPSRRTSRSAPARSRRRETSPPNYARGSAGCRAPARPDRPPESRSCAARWRRRKSPARRPRQTPRAALRKTEPVEREGDQLAADNPDQGAEQRLAQQTKPPCPQPCCRPAGFRPARW